MADMDPPGPGTKPDADLPTSLTRLAFHGPLSEARAARLIGRLTQAHAATVLDIGCGWGELMLRILAAAPDAIGVGLDTDEGDLARGRDNAKTRGLEDRVTFVRASGVGITRGPADLVLCVGASHALSDAQPPEHTAAALQALRRLVTPSGRRVSRSGWPGRPRRRRRFSPGLDRDSQPAGMGRLRVGVPVRRRGVARDSPRPPAGRRDPRASG